MDKYIIKRFSIYMLGLLTLALGIALSIRSQLGVSPVTSIPCVLNLTVGLSVGTLTFALYMIFIVAQIIILKKEFRRRDWLQIVFSSVFGIFTDIFLYLTIFIDANSIFSKIILCLASCVVIAMGVFLLVTTDIVINAPDGLCKTIAKKYNKEFGKVKIKFDLILVSVALLISIFAHGEIKQVGIGTVIAALLIGRIIDIFNIKLKDKVQGYYIVKES